jgi:2-oxoglutarate ferredoxin oxidoreductase subunit delta
MEGEITFKEERCKGCGICVAFCPKKILTLNTLGKIYVSDKTACINCGQCELLCPDYAIYVEKKVKK